MKTVSGSNFNFNMLWINSANAFYAEALSVQNFKDRNADGDNVIPIDSYLRWVVFFPFFNPAGRHGEGCSSYGL